MYAIKIRKSDLALLTLLNGGVAPDTTKQNTYLIVNPERPLENQVVNQKTFDQLGLKTHSPQLFALKK